MTPSPAAERMDSSMEAYAHQTDAAGAGTSCRNRTARPAGSPQITAVVKDEASDCLTLSVEKDLSAAMSFSMPHSNVSSTETEDVRFDFYSMSMAALSSPVFSNFRFGMGNSPDYISTSRDDLPISSIDETPLTFCQSPGGMNDRHPSPLLTPMKADISTPGTPPSLSPTTLSVSSPSPRVAAVGELADDVRTPWLFPKCVIHDQNLSPLLTPSRADISAPGTPPPLSLSTPTVASPSPSIASVEVPANDMRTPFLFSGEKTYDRYPSPPLTPLREDISTPGTPSPSTPSVSYPSPSVGSVGKQANDRRVLRLYAGQMTYDRSPSLLLTPLRVDISTLGKPPLVSRGTPSGLYSSISNVKDMRKHPGKFSTSDLDAVPISSVGGAPLTLCLSPGSAFYDERPSPLVTASRVNISTTRTLSPLYPSTPSVAKVEGKSAMEKDSTTKGQAVDTTRRKEFKCDVPGCHGVFRRVEHLKRHFHSVHTTEKPFQCPIPMCGKQFSRSDNLKQHIQTHKLKDKKVLPKSSSNVCY